LLFAQLGVAFLDATLLRGIALGIREGLRCRAHNYRK
jgi:hypothetical protein